MDRVKITRPDQAEAPLLVRTGHTPVNIGLLLGSLTASVAAAASASTRSAAVRNVLPLWAQWTFYAVLFLSAGIALSAIWRPLPSVLDEAGYRVISSRLVRERVGLYGVAGIMVCFSVSALAGTGWSAATAACWLGFIAGGLVLRARQTAFDLDKLHQAMDNPGASVNRRYVADPDEKT